MLVFITKLMTFSDSTQPPPQKDIINNRIEYISNQPIVLVCLGYISI
jgi:hypothetical protein